MSLGNLLLVEDDPNLGFVTQDNLGLAGFDVRWEKNGVSGLSAFKNDQFDICLLDIMMPNMDGFTLAKEIRLLDELVPILFLTARTGQEDRLHGFEIGGDDYIAKPFSMTELIYRVKVFLRRNSVHQSINPKKEQNIGAYTFDQANLQLRLKDQSISLTQMESDLINLLLRNQDTLVSREDILVAIWGENDYFKGRSLDVFISRLRKYFKKDPTVEIKNHHGVGFALMVNSK